MTLVLMLYFTPSLAKVMVNEMSPAVEDVRQWSGLDQTVRISGLTLASRVVSLTHVSVQPSGRGSVDDTSILFDARLVRASQEFQELPDIYLLTSEQRPTSLGHIESSSQMNSDDRVKLLVIHVLDRFVT